jgi:hypothetical protein
MQAHGCMNDEPHHQWGSKLRSQCFHRSPSWHRPYAMCWINAIPQEFESNGSNSSNSCSYGSLGFTAAW